MAPKMKRKMQNSTHNKMMKFKTRKIKLGNREQPRVELTEMDLLTRQLRTVSPAKFKRDNTQMRRSVRKQ